MLEPREQEILRFRGSGMTMRAIGEELGITSNRVSQLYHRALKKQRKARRKELASEANKKPVTITLPRSDWYVILTALRCLMDQRGDEILHTVAQMRQLHQEDMEYQRAEALRGIILDQVVPKDPLEP